MLCELLLKQLNELRLNNVYCDLELVAKDYKSVFMHRIVFTAFNQRHFQQALKTSGEVHVKPPCLKKMFLSLMLGEELKIFVEFLYGATIKKKSKYDLLVSALTKLDMSYLLKEAGVFILENDYLEDVKTELDDTNENPTPATDTNLVEEQHFTGEDTAVERSNECALSTNSSQVKQEQESPDNISDSNAQIIEKSTNTLTATENPEIVVNKTEQNVLEVNQIHDTEQIRKEIKIELNQDSECLNMARTDSGLEKVNEMLRNGFHTEDIMNVSDVGEVKYTEMSPLRSNDISPRRISGQSADINVNGKQLVNTASHLNISQEGQEHVTCSKGSGITSPSKKLRSLLPKRPLYILHVCLASQMPPALSKPISRTVTQPCILIPKEKTCSKLTTSNISAVYSSALAVSSTYSSVLTSRDHPLSELTNTRSSSTPANSLAVSKEVLASVSDSVIMSCVQTSNICFTRTSTVSSTATVSSPGILLTTPNSQKPGYMSSAATQAHPTVPFMISSSVSNTVVTSACILVSTPKSVSSPYVSPTIESFSTPASPRTSEIITSELPVSTQTSVIPSSVLSPQMPSSTVQTYFTLTSTKASEIPTSSDIFVSAQSSKTTSSELVSSKDSCFAASISPSVPAPQSIVTKEVLIKKDRSNTSALEKHIDNTESGSKLQESSKITSTKRKPLFKESNQVGENCLERNSSVGKILNDEAEHLKLKGPKSPTFEKEDGSETNDLQETEILVESAAAFLRISEMVDVKKEDDNTVNSDSNKATATENTLNNKIVNSDLTTAASIEDSFSDQSIREGQTLEKEASQEILSTSFNDSETPIKSTSQTCIIPSSEILKLTPDDIIAVKRKTAAGVKCIKKKKTDSSQNKSTATRNTLINKTVNSDLTTAVSVEDSFSDQSEREGQTLEKEKSQEILSTSFNDSETPIKSTSQTCIIPSSEILKLTPDDIIAVKRKTTACVKRIKKKNTDSPQSKATATGNILKNKIVNSDLTIAASVEESFSDQSEREGQTLEKEKSQEILSTSFNDSETPIKSTSRTCIIPSSEILKLTPDDIIAVKRKTAAGVKRIKKKKTDSPQTPKTSCMPKTSNEVKKTVDSGNLGQIQSVEKSCQISLIKRLSGDLEVAKMKSASSDSSIGQIGSVLKSSENSSVKQLPGIQNDQPKSPVEFTNKRRKIESRPCAVFIGNIQSEQSNLEFDISVNLEMNGELNAKVIEKDEETCPEINDKVVDKYGKVNENVAEDELAKHFIDDEANSSKSQKCNTSNDESPQIPEEAECALSTVSEKVESSTPTEGGKYRCKDTDKEIDFDDSAHQKDAVSEPALNQNSLQQCNEECFNEIQKGCDLLKNTTEINEHVNLQQMSTETELNEVADKTLSGEIEEMHGSVIVDKDKNRSGTLYIDKDAMKERYNIETNSCFQVQSNCHEVPENETFQSTEHIIQSTKASDNNKELDRSSVRMEISQVQTVPMKANVLPMMSTSTSDIIGKRRPKPYANTCNILPKLPVTVVRFPFSLQASGPSNKLSLCQLDLPAITNTYIAPNQTLSSELDSEKRKRQESGSLEKRKRHKSVPGNMSLEKEKLKKIQEIIGVSRPIPLIKKGERQKSKARKKSSLLKKKIITSAEDVQKDSEHVEAEAVKSDEDFLQRDEQTDSDSDAYVPLSKLKEKIIATRLSDIEKMEMPVTDNLATDMEIENEASTDSVSGLDKIGNETKNMDFEHCGLENQAESLEISKTVVNVNTMQQNSRTNSINKLKSQLKLLRSKLKMPPAKKSDGERCNHAFEITDESDREHNEEIVTAYATNFSNEKLLDSMDCSSYYQNIEVVESNHENECNNCHLAINEERANCVKNESNIEESDSCVNDIRNYSGNKIEKEHMLHDETKADRAGMIIDLTVHEDKTEAFCFGIPGVIQERNSQRRPFLGPTPELKKALLSPVKEGISNKFVTCNTCKANHDINSLELISGLCSKCFVRQENYQDKVTRSSENKNLQKGKVDVNFHGEQTRELQEKLTIEKAKQADKILKRKRLGSLKKMKSYTTPAKNKAKQGDTIKKSNENKTMSKDRIEFDIDLEKMSTFEERLAIEKAKRENKKLTSKRVGALNVKRSLCAQTCKKGTSTVSEGKPSGVLTPVRHSFEEKHDTSKDNLNEKRIEVTVSEYVLTSGASVDILPRPILPRLSMSSCITTDALQKILPVPNVFNGSSKVLLSADISKIEPVQLVPSAFSQAPSVLSTCTWTSTATSTLSVLSPFTVSSLSGDSNSEPQSMCMPPQNIASSETRALPTSILSSTAVSSLVSTVPDRSSSSAMLSLSPATRGTSTTPTSVSVPVTMACSSRALPTQFSSPLTVSSSSASVSRRASPNPVLSSMLASKPLAQVAVPTVLIFRSPEVAQKNQEFKGNSNSGTAYRKIHPKPY